MKCVTVAEISDSQSSVHIPLEGTQPALGEFEMSNFVDIVWFGGRRIPKGLDQGWPTLGQRAIFGPPRLFDWPSKDSVDAV
jgi:hypothetical protein